MDEPQLTTMSSIPVRTQRPRAQYRFSYLSQRWRRREGDEC
jgi:hypothetical protein